MHFHLFKSIVTKNWYFHLRARNGRIIAQSKGYKRRAKALATIRKIILGASRAAIKVDY